MQTREDCQLVLVEWLDSRQPIASWMRLSEFETQGVCKCVSVGFVLKKERGEIVLSPNMADIEDEQNIQTCGVIHIPLACVTKITGLAEQ